MSVPHQEIKMAAILEIQQGPVYHNDRSISMRWRVVNTTILEENQLMRSVFYPLFVKHYNELSPMDRKKVDSAVDRFFTKGMFLMLEQLEQMNAILEKLGYEQFEIDDNGQYFQPTEPGQRKPSAKAWANNARARTAEMNRWIDLIESGQETSAKRLKNPAI